MPRVRNAVAAMEKTLTRGSVARAHAAARQEVLEIRLSELRRRLKIRQSDLPSFTQSAISRLEARRDMKLSTLVGYLKDLGLRVEIRVTPRTAGTRARKEIVLLRA